MCIRDRLKWILNRLWTILLWIIYGLEMNLNRTEYTCIEVRQQDLVLDKGQQIKRCTDYKYLGLNITQNRTLDEAIPKRDM